jgi:hypothetical protein
MRFQERNIVFPGLASRVRIPFLNNFNMSKPLRSIALNDIIVKPSKTNNFKRYGVYSYLKGKYIAPPVNRHCKKTKEELYGPGAY